MLGLTDAINRLAKFSNPFSPTSQCCCATCTLKVRFIKEWTWRMVCTCKPDIGIHTPYTTTGVDVVNTRVHRKCGHVEERSATFTGGAPNSMSGNSGVKTQKDNLLSPIYSRAFWDNIQHGSRHRRHVWDNLRFYWLLQYAIILFINSNNLQCFIIVALLPAVTMGLIDLF